MKSLIYFLLLCVSIVQCQIAAVKWADIACLANENDYFTEVMQRTMNSIETDINWCNMKVDDINKSVNKSYYNWHVLGTISWTNSFTISLKGIQLTKMNTIFSTRKIDGKDHGNVYMEGTLQLKGLKIGFDVKAHFANIDENSFSVTYEYKSIDILCSLSRDLVTNVTTTSTRTTSVPGASSVKAVYLPASNITDVVNREFKPNANSFEKWGEDIIAPLLKKYASVLDFPEIRFGGC